MRRINLSEYTSVRLGGYAFGEVVTDFGSLKLSGDEIVIGRGTNLLASDLGVTEKVIIVRAANLSVSGNSVVAEGGVPLPLACRAAAEAGLSGLEWACGIPGSAGGGVVMNAGAYGGEISDVLNFVEVLTPRGVVRLNRGDLDFSYRSCKGLPRGAIVKAGFALVPGDRDKIKARMRELNIKRRKAQPSGRTFGSTFSRVGDKSAGELIDKAGLKGLRIGGARISDKHANFILTDGGTATDVRNLIDTVKLKVYARFGVKLKEEVGYIGEF